MVHGISQQLPVGQFSLVRQHPSRPIRRQLVLLPIQPIAPVLRSTMQVHYGQDDDPARILHIDDRVGESNEPTASNAVRQGMPPLRMALDEADASSELKQECISQPRELRVVVRHRVVELKLGRREEANHHRAWYFASTSPSATAETSPRRKAANRSFASAAQDWSIP